jgi:hypothetical protein
VLTNPGLREEEMTPERVAEVLLEEEAGDRKALR